MATKIELKNELRIALDEIGSIKPWFDDDFNAWIFSHPLYPVECEGNSKEEVQKKYPKYLEVFLEHRIEGRIGEINERKTKGKGGYRPGAGRPKGSSHEPTKQIRLPTDIVFWMKQHPDSITKIRKIMGA